MENENTKKSVKKKSTSNGVTIRWDNKNIISSVTSYATAKANKKTKRVTENVVEMKGTSLVKRDTKTGKFVKIKKIDPVAVSNGKITLKIKRKQDEL